MSTSGTIVTEGETLRSFTTATVKPDATGNLVIEMKPNGGFVIEF